MTFKVVVVLALIIVFGLFLIVGNMIKVPYTAMVYYMENESHEVEVCESEYKNETRWYNTTKLSCKRGDCLKPSEEPKVVDKGGFQMELYGCDEWEQICTNETVERAIIVWKWGPVCWNETKERELVKERPETFHRTLFEEWGLVPTE